MWDEPKRLATLKLRGLDFADVAEEFIADAMVIRAKLGRLMAIGELGGQTLTVVFAPLGREAISIVSMRVASRKERRFR